MLEQYQALQSWIKQFEKVAVCLSGSANSVLLTKAAADALGAENVVAITAETPFFTGEEIDFSMRLSKALGIRHLMVKVNTLEDADVAKNTENRCYYCKMKTMKAICRMAGKERVSAVLEASTCIGSLNPALEQLDIKSPLYMMKIDHAMVYGMLKELGLKHFVPPEDVCLATRVQTGQPITIKKLRLIRAAENYLKSMGLKAKVLMNENDAKLLMPADMLPVWQEMHQEAETELCNLGYEQIDIDCRE